MEEDSEIIKYKKIDRLLDKVATLLIKEIKKEDLINSTFTKWRWDIPEIMIQWRSHGISRNIVVLIEKNGDLINIECNAWLDKDINVRQRERHWYHKNIDTLEGFSEEKIETLIKVAYQTINDLKVYHLDRIEYI